MIESLQTVGGNEDIFNQLKYSIATTIVSEDFYSERSHDRLMEEIRCELFKPQAGLSSFTHELNCSKEESCFQQSAAAATAQDDTLVDRYTLGFFDQTTSSSKRKRTAVADEPTASAATSKHSR